ncbi:hypothetical protein GCM10007989_05130 [Devosia pacifica]|uniref:Toprim domain-containing protein n=1 Tax=Devosia pacifica TaxID=1335967 RepID=A0A918VQ46_9HYPH|nr:hypothetical protein [Devosia pacifica]GHA13505.1 hypothetical protein GCM10007989_05130 [Devosia pacifica]
MWLKEQRTAEDKRRFAERKARDEKRDRERSERASNIAERLVTTAKMDGHPYLRRKGFQTEKALVIGADAVREIGGEYLVPDRAMSAIVVPARVGVRLASVQLIWEDGTKKFLAGGQMGGAWHRIATGADTWLCEGYATALSIRMALKGLGRRDTVLVCFSAANIVKVSGSVRGRCFVAADHDMPPSANPEQFGGLGAGEHFARQTGKPYTMPPGEKMDLNDLHAAEGIFAVQRLILSILRERST